MVEVIAIATFLIELGGGVAAAVLLLLLADDGGFCGP